MACNLLELHGSRAPLKHSTTLRILAPPREFHFITAVAIAAAQKFCRTECGYAGVRDVEDCSLDEQMPSFFLSETLKYLYLLFDEVGRSSVPYILVSFCPIRFLARSFSFVLGTPNPRTCPCCRLPAFPIRV